MNRSLIATVLVAASVTALARPALAGNCYDSSGSGCVTGKPHALPTSVASFLALRDKLAKTPLGGATLFIHALMVWVDKPKFGEAMLTIALARNKLAKGSAYKGFKPGRSATRKLVYAKRKPYCIRGFASGSRHTNGYKLDRSAITLRFRTQKNWTGSVAGGKYKVFACHAGRSSCAPMTLRRNSRGVWKVSEWSSLVMGCRPPVTKVDDNL